MLKTFLLKAITFLTILAVFTCGLSPAAQAETVTYNLPELYLNISIPAEFSTLTRQMDGSEAILESLGFSAEDMRQLMEADHIYLNAISADYTTSLVVTMEEYSGSQNIFNLSDFDDSSIAAIADDMIDSEEAANQTVIFGDYSIVRQDQIAFIVLPVERTVAEVPAYEHQYTTVFNGQLIKLVLRSLGTPLTDAQKQLQEEAVSSMQFTTVLDRPADSQSGPVSIQATAHPVSLLIPGIAAVILILGLVFWLHLRQKKRAGNSKKEK